MRVSIFGVIALGTVFGVVGVLDVVSGQWWGWGGIVGGGLALSGAVVAVRAGRSPR